MRMDSVEYAKVVATAQQIRAAILSLPLIVHDIETLNMITL